jgi:hypothetical protein
MASLDLYFKEPLRDIPSEHVTLMDDSDFAGGRIALVESSVSPTRARTLALARSGDIASRFALSFVDNFQAWHGDDKRTETWLNVVSADFDELSELPKEKARAEIVRELRRYLHFEEKEIDWDRADLQLNRDAELFMNSVGSWQFRPETRTDDPAYRTQWVHSTVSNLYLAGDYCRSKIDLVSLEGAVTTGIAAARAIATNAGRADRVKEPLVPPEVSRQDCERAKRELAPLLAAATRRRHA